MTSPGGGVTGVSKPDNRAACRLRSLAAAVLFGAATVAGSGGWERPHRIAASCPGSFGSPARRCLECHAIEAALSHPIDVVPSMAVPSRLPLVDGRITCATCHRTDDSGQPHLSGPSEMAPTFCAQCHDPMASTGAAPHAVAGSRAHLRWPGRTEDSGVTGSLPGASPEGVFSTRKASPASPATTAPLQAASPERLPGLLPADNSPPACRRAIPSAASSAPAVSATASCRRNVWTRESAFSTGASVAARATAPTLSARRCW